MNTIPTEREITDELRANGASDLVIEKILPWLRDIPDGENVSRFEILATTSIETEMPRIQALAGYITRSFQLDLFCGSLKKVISPSDS